MHVSVHYFPRTTQTRLEHLEEKGVWPINGEDPRIIRSRVLILDAATSVFLERGYTAATVDDVAIVAGVAKRTIYNLYGDKDELFRATIRRSIAVAERFSASLAEEVREVADPRAELPRVALKLARAVLTDPVLPLRRLLVMESTRFPELVKEYRERAPEAVMRALAELFASLARDGHLTLDDPAAAAEHFAFLVMGADLDRGMFVPSRPDPDTIEAHARNGAGAFLRAYAPART